MITNQKIEYMRRALQESQDYIDDLKSQLEAEGFNEDQAQRGLEQALCFHAQMQEEFEALQNELLDEFIEAVRDA